MNVSAIIMMVLGLAFLWGGFGICVSIAMRKKN